MVIHRQLFAPLSALFQTRSQAGRQWDELVSRISTLPHNDPQVMAFRLTVDRLRREQGRSRGSCRDIICTHCLKEITAQFKGSEEDLLAFYHRNLTEVNFRLRAMLSNNAAQRRGVRAA